MPPALPASGPAIRFENLTLGYDRHPAVHHLDAEIPAGSLAAIVGPNGAGKSTLLKGVAGELRPLEGHIHIKPQERAHAALAYMQQRNELDSGFPVAVFDMVAMGLWRETGAFRGLGRTGQGKVHAALDAVGLSGFESRPIGTLSSGQLQRARFARLILQDAPTILLDEPFAAIDALTVGDLTQLLLHWHDEGRTVLVVTHDFTQVRRYFPACLLLARELVAFGPTAEVMTEPLLARARQLSEAFDEHAGTCSLPESA